MTPHISLAVVLGFSVAFNEDHHPVESIAPREPPIILEEEPWTMMQHIAKPAPLPMSSPSPLPDLDYGFQNNKWGLPLPMPSPSPALVKTDSPYNHYDSLYLSLHDVSLHDFKFFVRDLYEWLGLNAQVVLQELQMT